MEASLCCLLQRRRGRDVSLCQVSHPPAPPSAALTPPGPADPSPPFPLSPAGGQADSLSKGAFSLLSWKALPLAS